MEKINALDTFMLNSLRAFFVNQREAYLSTMSNDDPNIAYVQAKYETANLALAAVCRFVADVNDNDAMVPEPLQKAMMDMHDAICEYGDAYLRRLGYKPEEF